MSRTTAFLLAASLFACKSNPAAPNSSLSGKVVLHGVTDASGIVVTLAGPATGATATAADGTYAFTGLPDGTYAVTASPRSAAPSAATVAATVAGTATAPDLAFDALGAITGAATFDGAASGNAGITVLVAGTSAEAVTDEAGRYQIDGVTVGPHTIIASAPGRATQTTAITVGYGVSTAAEGLALPRPAPAAGAVGGRVLLSGSPATPAAAIAVTLSGPVAGAALTDATGAYSFGALPDGDYSITAVAPSTAESVQTARATVAGAAANAADIEFHALGTVAGIATLGTAASGNAGTIVQAGGAAAITADDGSYTINAVPIGSATITATHAGYLGASVSALVQWRERTSAGAMQLQPASNPRTLTVSSSGPGVVTSIPAGIYCGPACTATFEQGQSVQLVAVPGAGATFDGWTGACSGTDACTVTLADDTSVGASFSQPTLTVDVSSAGAGTGTVTSQPAGIACAGACSASFAAGATVVLQAAADAGSVFTGWSGDCSGTGACVLVLSGPVSVIAGFDLGAPLHAVIATGPQDPSRSASARFSFSATGAASYQCTLDGATAACTSPVEYDALPDGAHRFTAAAIDASGLAELSPPSWSWTIDTIPPVTTLEAKPGNPSNVKAPQFAFSSSEPSSTFSCRLDQAAYPQCTSPFTAPTLADGAHAFSVYAVDLAGNADPLPATYSWTVDTAAPTASITGKPADPSNDTAPSFAFASTKAGTFTCSLDGAQPAVCSSPQPYSALGAGPHQFSVVAIDLAGNPSAPATYGWVIDLALPTASINAHPADPTNATAATFSFGSTEAGTFMCKLDGAVYSACSSPKAYSGLGAGTHSFSVIATDTAGNSSTPATFGWLIDLTPPFASIDAKPANPTNATSTSFSFSSSKTGSTFSCTLDGATASCTSPQAYSGFSAGSHTFSVVATDPAGNQSSPASYTWQVDLTKPVASITDHPADPSNVVAPSFSFDASKSGSTFVCQLDTNPPGSCTSPKTYAGMPDGSHTFSVVATDPAGNVSDPASFTWTVNTAALTAPTPIAVTTGDGALTVSWTAVNGAASYTVYYGATPALGSVITGLTGTSTTIGGLDNCGTYYFTVTDTDPSGNECGQPAQVQGSPKPTPPVVTALGASGSISLNWGATGADSYKVYYGSQPGGPYDGTAALNGPSPIAQTSTSITLGGLPPFSRVFAAVSSLDGACEGPLSAESASSPVPWRSLNPNPTDKQLRAISCAGGSLPCIAMGAAGTALLSTDGTTWAREYSATTNTFIAAQMVSAKVGYAIAGTDVYKTTNGGTAWLKTTTISPSQTLYALAFADENTGIVSAGSGNVVKTTDGGATWTVSNTGTLASWFGIWLAGNGQNAIAVGQSGVIRTSSDGGQSWTNRTSGTGNDLQAVTCFSGNCWAVGSGGVILASADGGASWSAQSSGFGGVLRGVAFSSPANGWVVGDSGTVLVTSDIGGTWTPQAGGETGTLWSVALGTAPNSAYFSGDNGILRNTTDGGNSWSSQRSVLTSAQLNRVKAFDADHVLAIGNGGVVLRSADGGSTWTTTAPTSANLMGLWFTDASTGWVVGSGGAILKTADGGASWTAQASGVSITLNAVNCLDTLACYATGGNQLLSTSDGGNSWSAVTITALGQQPLCSVRFIDPNDGFLGSCYTGGGNAVNFLRTIDGGVFWQNASVDASGHGSNGGFGPVQAIYADPTTVVIPATSPAWGQSRMARSTDGGATWSTLFSTGDSISDLAVRNGLWVATTSNGAAWVSTNGTNWSRQATGFTGNLRGVDAGDGITVYAVGDNGTIMKTATAGK